MNKQLSIRTNIDVRFSEVDALQIVWHGNYFKYFEDGREAFAKTYGIDYLYFYEEGFLLPVVKADINFKKMLKYGDNAIVETRLTESPAAKLIFHYTIYSIPDNEVICTGYTVQVFVDRSGVLQLTSPGFFKTWKKQWLETQS
jgi:acyl-CoA thioester hydrolase